MDPPAAVTEPRSTQTLAERLSRGVLNTARSVDASARISSIARWEHDDSTLLLGRDQGAQGGDSARRLGDLDVIMWHVLNKKSYSWIKWPHTTATHASPPPRIAVAARKPGQRMQPYP